MKTRKFPALQAIGRTAMVDPTLQNVAIKVAVVKKSGVSTPKKPEAIWGAHKARLIGAARPIVLHLPR